MGGSTWPWPIMSHNATKWVHLCSKGSGTLLAHLAQPILEPIGSSPNFWGFCTSAPSPAQTRFHCSWCVGICLIKMEHASTNPNRFTRTTPEINLRKIRSFETTPESTLVALRVEIAFPTTPHTMTSFSTQSGIPRLIDAHNRATVWQRAEILRIPRHKRTTCDLW
jgi:hypothetical protein